MKKLIITAAFITAVFSPFATQAQNIGPKGYPLFTDPMSAQTHCPSERVVWVQQQARLYLFQGQPGYGGFGGVYACQSDAYKAGFRPVPPGVRVGP